MKFTGGLPGIHPAIQADNRLAELHTLKGIADAGFGSQLMLLCFLLSLKRCQKGATYEADFSWTCNYFGISGRVFF